MNNKMPKTLIDVLEHLSEINKVFPYSTLGLVLDKQNLFDLLRVFGGKTLYIPTVQEFTRLLQFCLVEEIGDYETAATISPEALNGFTKSRYDSYVDLIHNGIKPTKKKEKNRKRKAQRDQKKLRDKEECRGGGSEGN